MCRVSVSVCVSLCVSVCVSVCVCYLLLEMFPDELVLQQQTVVTGLQGRGAGSRGWVLERGMGKEL